MLEMQERQREDMRHRFPEDMQHDVQRGADDQHREGAIARMIDQQTAKLPSDVFLWSAIGSMACSCMLYMSGKKHESLFVGQWAAPLLLCGIYSKIVKGADSDRASHATA